VRVLFIFVSSEVHVFWQTVGSWCTQISGRSEIQTSL
jgi:hypothetical protein